MIRDSRLETSGIHREMHTVIGPALDQASSFKFQAQRMPLVSNNSCIIQRNVQIATFPMSIILTPSLSHPFLYTAFRRR